ncbi:MAG: purine-nucleoside phosphorylase [Desulfamplus sp.]|nr:purine-nucleoside phosphorylase [Desulfamplus sp.]
MTPTPLLHYHTRVKKGVEYLKNRIQMPQRIAVLAGTGLGGLINTLTVSDAINYTEIPGFPVSTVKSHSGRIICGNIDGVSVLLLSGRCHLYEGYLPEDICLGVRVLQQLGVQRIVVTNAAGGINQNFSTGDIMIIRDHINLTGQNPLVGDHIQEWGTRFPDMTAAYAPDAIALTQRHAAALKINVHTGVYAGLLGPSFETPAEIRFLQTIGADAVGLSTVMEVITAIHGGMSVLGLSVITNIADPDNPMPIYHDNIIATANKATETLCRLIRHVILDFI